MVRGTSVPTGPHSRRLRSGSAPTLTPMLIAGLLAFTAILALTPTQAQLDTDLGLINTAPTVVSVSPLGLTSPLFEVTPQAGTTKTVNIDVVVQDLNGCNDLSKIDVTVKDPAGATLNTEEITTRDSCSLTTLATYSYEHTLQFYHAPGDYDIEIVATDSEAATGSNLLDLTSFRVEELVALSAPASLSFGTGLQPNATTDIKSVAVQNTGNVMIDTQVSGSALDHATEADSIALSNIAWSEASDLASSQALTGSAVTASTFDLDKGAASSDNLYLQVTIPTGLAAGTYSGSLTVGAVKSV